MENTLVLTAYLRNEKAKSNTQVPIYLRVTLNKKKALFSVSHYINPKKWNPITQTVKGSDLGIASINNDILLLKTKINDIVGQCNKDGFFINHEILKKKLEGNIEDRFTLITYFKKHNDRLKTRIGKDYSLGTWKSYNTALNKIQLFIEDVLKRKDVFLKELNYQFIDGFENYLKVSGLISNNSSMKYLQCLKAVVNTAIKASYLDKNPFVGFSCSYDDVRRDLLNYQELTKLKNHHFRVDQHKRVKNIFLFSCYTGLAYADIQKLAKEHIIKGIDGKLWIEIYRTKTKIRSPIPLLPEALNILNETRWKEKDLCELIFNVYTNQAINRILKEIAIECDIKKSITYHMARHTFATTVTLTNNVPIETVSKMLGHTNLKTTQIYAKVIDSKISDDMRQLMEKL